MFETVRPDIVKAPSRTVLYETLPVSIALHLVFAAAFVAGTYWKVAFPADPPQLMALYRVMTEAPPPPPPPPPPPKGSSPTVQTKPTPVSTEIVAPTVIPEEIPLVTANSFSVKEVPGPDTGVEGGMEGGVAGGEVGGVVGGIVGGIISGPPPPGNTVVVPRDQPLPVSPMSMVYPHYPEEGRIHGWEDRVIVRYVIGTNGKVKEVLVLDKAERMAFTKSTVEAIKRWKFKPLIVDGVAKEVVHELTVYFKLEQS